MEEAKTVKLFGFIKHLNIIVLMVTGLFILSCYIGTGRCADNTNITKEIKPYLVSSLDDGSTEYLFNLDDFESQYTGIMFYTSHQKVWAYSVGETIYSFDKTGGFWGSTTGSLYNFIELNDSMSNVAIVVKPIYEAVTNQDITFYIGAPHVMFKEVMEKSMPRFIVSLLVLMVSLFLMIYYSLMKSKQNLNKELTYLAYFAFFCGLWSLVETEVANMMMQNRVVESLVPYFCLMLVNPPFILFFDEYLKLNSKWFRHAIVSISMAQFIILSVLHFTKIAEFRETLPFMQLLLIINTIYLVVRVIIKLINKNFTRRVEICAIGLTLFAIAVIVDISMYYKRIGDADVMGRYVFLIFVVLLTWDLIRGTYEIIEKGRRAKQLEIFALTDSMTGLLNRNAFESHAEADNSLNGLVAIVADANGLKNCNDTLGHEAGDNYITIVAEIFSSVFGKYGNCYRTGGDEFCCIIPSGKHLNMERLKKLFLAKIYTENIEGGYDFDIGVAIGYALYDAEVDEDFRSVVKRADSNMYENKRSYKIMG